MTTTSQPVFPNVRCGAGHPDEPGYVVCRHVIAGEPAFYQATPTPRTLGQILCRPCAQKASRGGESDARLVCATCVRVKGYGK